MSINLVCNIYLYCFMYFIEYRGYIAPDYNPVGNCTNGTYGVLCTACYPGFSRTGKYSC